ncbi:MAG: ABC transporter ATP-binding protein [Erysipelotrichaceae bacterium]|jgi:simple sugar transport system ATP-binding protein|nr:ABC transporter ATP-binding protein [Erysipelotrichaceae bacterium]
MSETNYLELRKITKVYPNGVIANEDVNMVLQRGEIHALMGENGAGKTTLMKILFGIEQPTSGEIYLEGQKIEIHNPLDAISKKIGMVHQHFMMDENLTVTENVILGMEPTKGLSLDTKKAREMTMEIAKKYNFKITPDKRVMDLSVGQKQKVEILKALIRGAQLLILDEPTAVLTPQETEELFEQLKILRDEGHTIIFISHKLNEVKHICSRATVLRGGKSVGSHDLKDISLAELSKLMVGRDVVREIEKQKAKPGDAVLEVKNLKVLNDELVQVVNDVSFKLRKGEILGIVGVEGNGQRQLIDCVTGLESEYQGEILIDGKVCAHSNGVKQRRDAGLNHIPEDRLTYGVIANATLLENLISNTYDKKENNKGIFMDDKKNSDRVTDLISRFQIKTDSKHTLVRMLSGGNMQKVVAAREMSTDMSILVADQPTRGIDVGTESFIHDRLVEMRDKGVAVLLVSADINEVMELSDSLIVFYEGEITAYFPDASKVTEEELGLYMLGLKKMKDEEIAEVAK